LEYSGLFGGVSLAAADWKKKNPHYRKFEVVSVIFRLKWIAGNGLRGFLRGQTANLRRSYAFRELRAARRELSSRNVHTRGDFS